MNTLHVDHPFQPVYDNASTILILGSFPSVRSRQQGFYYGHPQNRFWKMLSAIYNAPLPSTNSEKNEFLHEHHIALWDVLESCDIIGSSDSSIRNAKPNDLSQIISDAPIQKILCNGKQAWNIYMKYSSRLYGPALLLPSTSPANAAWSLERLIAEWKIHLFTEN